MLALGHEDLKGSIFRPFAYVKKGAGFPVIFQVALCHMQHTLGKGCRKEKKTLKEKFQKLFDRPPRFQKVQ
jgi:hypothetical protein